MLMSRRFVPPDFQRVECAARDFRFWPFATCGPETVVGRFRGKADSGRFVRPGTLAEGTGAVPDKPVLPLTSNAAIGFEVRKGWRAYEAPQQ